MNYLKSISPSDSRDILRLTKRPQGLTIECVQCIKGEITILGKETFFDAEKAAEFYFNYEQHNFADITFNY